MNILPYQVHSLLRIYHNPLHDSRPSDRTRRPGTGRKDVIKSRILADVLRRIR